MYVTKPTDLSYKNVLIKKKISFFFWLIIILFHIMSNKMENSQLVVLKQI